MGKLFVTFGCIFGILTAEDEEEDTRSARLSLSRAPRPPQIHISSRLAAAAVTRKDDVGHQLQARLTTHSKGEPSKCATAN